MKTPPASPLERGGLILLRCFAASLAVQAHAQAALVNPGFETGNLNGWSSLGCVSASSEFSYGGFVGSVAPNPGSFAGQLIACSDATAAQIATAMGISEATLESSNSGVDAAFGTLISQTVSASAGGRFTFNWNFVERDYGVFDDWSFFGVSFNGISIDLRKLASVADVAPEEEKMRDETTIGGWKTFEYQIAAAGDYTFHFGVVNARDNQLGSELWVDAPVSSIPEPGSVLGLGLLLGSGLLVRSRRRTVQRDAA